jgi:hypothetical protein
MQKLSPALVISIIALFVALGGAGMAATGGNFILGKANSATSTSSLSAPIGGKALQVSNTSTTAGATALGLTAAPGHAPFTVNTSTKVAKLNADTLDAIDSTGFVHGRGTALANRLVFAPTAHKILLGIPGLGYLRADCTSTDAFITWWNNTAGSVDLWRDFTNSHFFGFTVPAGLPNGYPIADQISNVYGGTVALGAGSEPNPRRMALLHAFVLLGGGGAPCTFEVQGTLWTSP